VRAYLSAGVLTARDSDGFSRQSAYLAFNLDTNWRRKGDFLVNSFFETRLASVPAEAGEGLVASQKTAQVQGGIYLPWITTRWKANGTSYSLFVAPLAKAGIETPTERAINRFYNSAGGGIRLGHFRNAASREIAPELISYVDVTYGRSGPLGQRGLAIEGILKAPGTPLIVGFGANLGAGENSRDDLRFLFGTRFDLGNLTARLKQLR
jgi:hypothetical protein